VSPGIKSFGYSLSGSLDMDFNGYSGEVIKLGSQVVHSFCYLPADGIC